MKRSHLAEVQRAFARIVRHDTDAAAALADAAAPFDIVPAGRLTAEAALDIHNGGYLSRLRNALRADFPGVAVALGDAAFLDLARRYAATHPSRHPNLFHFGRQLPVFIAGQRDLPLRGVLRDLARLEQAKVDAFHADDAPPLDPARLAEIPVQAWADATLVLHPSVRLLALQWPVAGWLDALRSGADTAPPRRAVEHVAVHRVAERVTTLALTAGAFRCLTALSGQRALGEALEFGAADANDAADWLRQWTASRLVVGVDVSR